MDEDAPLRRKNRSANNEAGSNLGVQRFKVEPNLSDRDDEVKLDDFF